MSRADRLLRQHLRSRFLFTLLSGDAFDGVLVDHDEAHYVLADAAAFTVKGERTPADGQVWLPRSNVSYLQASVAPGRWQT